MGEIRGEFCSLGIRPGIQAFNFGAEITSASFPAAANPQVRAASTTRVYLNLVALITVVENF